MKQYKQILIVMIVGLFTTMPMTLSAQNNTWNSLSDWRERKAQMARPDSVLFYITATDVLAHCFENCDVNGDRKITVSEAAVAKVLVLDQGGRSNIINNYDFLRYFTNLTALSVGNTPVESINLRHQPKLEKLNLTNAIFLKEVILAEGCNPEITYNPNEKQPIIKHYSNQLPTDIDPATLVPNSKKVNPNHKVITLEGDIFSQCFTDIDTDHDGVITAGEAAAATQLILDRGGRSNIITNYDFLPYFTNLETLSVGNTPAESIDLRPLKNLKRVNFTNAIFLKEVILPKGCNPEMFFAQDQERPTIIHK